MSNKLNSKEVKTIIRKHILENINQDSENIIENVKAYKDQLNINSIGYAGRRISFYNTVKNTLQGCYGSFYFTTQDINDFIDSLNINNNSSKKYSDEEIADLYYNLVARESEYIFSHMIEKELNKMLSAE